MELIPVYILFSFFVLLALTASCARAKQIVAADKYSDVLSLSGKFFSGFILFGSFFIFTVHVGIMLAIPINQSLIYQFNLHGLPSLIWGVAIAALIWGIIFATAMKVAKTKQAQTI